ncbi:hypothetical protein BH09MYX1_BH09MYX1_23780 [soil metagenome]
MVVKYIYAGAIALALLTAPIAANADDPSNPSSGLTAVNFAQRPHTVAMLELGILALPGTPISSSQAGGDTPFGRIGSGDATLQAGIDILFRVAKDWVIGAGFLFGPRPTSDPEYGGLGQLPRSHSRSYLSTGAEIRWVPLHTRFIEAWVGATTGIIIIADRFSTDAGIAKPTVFGERVVTLRTEGLSLGIEAGFDWSITDRFVAGFGLRAAHWFLPSNPQCSPIGDCTTLLGSANAIGFGITFGYRIPL